MPVYTNKRADIVELRWLEIHAQELEKGRSERVAISIANDEVLWELFTDFEHCNAHQFPSEYLERLAQDLILSFPCNQRSGDLTLRTTEQRIHYCIKELRVWANDRFTRQAKFNHCANPVAATATMMDGAWNILGQFFKGYGSYRTVSQEEKGSTTSAA